MNTKETIDLDFFRKKGSEGRAKALKIHGKDMLRKGGRKKRKKKKNI